MAERITTVKMTATRNRSERLNASRKKHGGRKETKAVVSVLILAISQWSKRRFSMQIVDEHNFVGSKQGNGQNSGQNYGA